MREDPNADEKALNYPEFLLKVGEGLATEKGDGEERIIISPSIEQLRFFEFLFAEKSRKIHNCYAAIEWISSRVILILRKGGV